MFGEFERVPYAEGPAVYLLVDKGTVVYVGKSKKGLARINDHALKGWGYDSVYVRYCKRGEDPGVVEHEAIVKYRPKYNTDFILRSDGPWVPLTEVLGLKRRF